MANHYQPSAVLRDNAKGFLNGKYKFTIGSTMILLGLYWVVSQLSTRIGEGLRNLFVKSGAVGLTSTVMLYFFEFVVSFVFVCLMAVVSIGLSFYYLKIGTGSLPRVSDVFSGFREDFKKNLLAGFLVNLPLVLSTEPGLFTFIMYRNTGKTIYLYLTVGLELVGLISYIFFALSFKMTYYILADFPEYTAAEAIKASWNKISGHRGRLFVLALSFIPYTLLATLSFGVGYLWVYPLVQESYAQFYLDLMNPRKVTGEWERTV